MEAEEFVQLWHASFGPETQPPESCSNLGKRLTAQDVGTELRACETRVESLRTQLTRELRALELLRRLVADLERRESGGGDSTRHRIPSEGEGSALRSRAASQPHRDKPAHSEPGSPYTRKSASVPASPRRARPDIVFSTSVHVAVKSKDQETVPSCDSTERERPGTDGPTTPDEKNRRHSDGVGGERRGSVIRERAPGQANEADKCVARAVRKRLIEQGKWWSSNLLTLQGSLQVQTPPINRRRSVSDPPVKLHGQRRRGPVPSIKVHKVIESFEKLCQETAPKVNAAVGEKEISHVLRRHTSLETVNEREKPLVVVDKKVGVTSQSPPESDRLGSLPVRRTQSEKQEEKYIFPGCKNHVVYSTHSLNRRYVKSQLTQLEEEGPTSSTLKRQQLSIEAKLADRRRTGGWKVVEVGGQRRLLSKTPSLQQINVSTRAVCNDRAAQHKEHYNTENTRVTQHPQGNNRGVHSGAVSEVAHERRVTPVKTRSSNMFKAAKEKLSRVTSSPPLRRRLSRGSRGREGPQHRSSNGQVEQTSSSVSPSPVPPSGGGGVQEVMVEKRVERSESLLSEIMSHRFSNGMEGSQLLESGEHSLLESQEGSGGESANIPKVILRRRSERDNDPLPEAKRRSSCLEEDDCSTPKEDFSLSLGDDNLTQGLTQAMVEEKRPQMQRMASDSTLRQDSLEATLTPASITSGGSPTPAPGNVNYRMSYMTAVYDSPQMVYASSGGGGGLRDSNQVDYMPLINESEGETTASGRLALVSSEPNLLDLHQYHMLEDSMELDEATISAVTLNNDLFGSRSGSVTSLPETLNDSQSTSTASLTEPLLSPSHTPAPVVNLRPSSGSSGAGRRRNRKREGNAELDDQTGASLVEMLSSERLRSPNTTASSSQYSMTSSLSPPGEEVMVNRSGSPTLFPPPLHGTHLKEVETHSPGTTRSSRIYPVRRSTVVVQGEKLVIRKLVVAGIVSAEKSYLDCLNVMKEFYRKPLLARTTTSQTILSERDINTVFYRTEDLVDLHTALHEKLEPQLRDWTVNTCVGDFFVELCKNLKLYKDYVEFYQQSLQCLEKLKSESAPFRTFLEDVRATVMAHYNDVPRVNELLRRPIERLQSYSLILNDLCQHTPEDHKDYSVLRQSLHVMSAFIASTHDPQSFSKLSGGYNRELVKEGLMVELSEGIRKVRRVFLFHDVIVSSKQKPTRAGVKFEPKWYLPLAELSFHPPEESPEAHRPVPATSDMDLSVMRNRIAELKAQIGKENTRDRSGSQPEREGSFRKGRGGIRGIYTMKSSRAVERTKKKLQEQQVSYWMAVPSLPLRLYGDNGKQQYMFLLHSEQERENWLSSIKKLQPKAVRSVSFNTLELQDLLSHQTISELRKIEEVTQPVLGQPPSLSFLKSHSFLFPISFLPPCLYFPSSTLLLFLFFSTKPIIVYSSTISFSYFDRPLNAQCVVDLHLHNIILKC
jgi:hypothetical protein